MSKNVKRLLMALAVMFVGLIVWVVKTTPDGPPPSSDKVAPPMTMEYEGNELSEEINGVRIWDLTADRMVVDANTQNADLEKLVGHFYQTDGRTIEFRAEHGVYDYSTHDIHVEGNITVETSDGARLLSGKLDWINADGMLVATEDVKISRDDVKATGDRAESADGFNHFWLKGNAHITKGIELEEEEPVEEQFEEEKNKASALSK